MLQSPSGKRDYAGARNMTKVDGNDALRYLDIGSPTYQADADFLLKNCKSKRLSLFIILDPSTLRIINLYRYACTIKRCQ